MKTFYSILQGSFDGPHGVWFDNLEEAKDFYGDPDNLPMDPIVVHNYRNPISIRSAELICKDSADWTDQDREDADDIDMYVNKYASELRRAQIYRRFKELYE